jgi:signal transduction histidine kinase
MLDAYLAARSTEQHIQGQLGEVARTLLEADFPLTDRVLRQTRGLSGAEFAITDEFDRVLAASFAAPRFLPAPQSVQSLERFRLGAAHEVVGESYIHSVVGADQRGRPEVGQRLHLLYPERILSEACWRAAYPPMLVGGLALVAVSLVAVVIASRLSRPILALRGRLGRLALGDFRPEPLPSRNDEIRDLVGSVNMLAAELDEMRRAIKRAERLTLLGQLGGGLAHHLRNDVTGARMAVQLHGRQCRHIDQESLRVALRQLELTEEHLQRFLAAGQPQPLRRVECDLRRVLDMVSSLVEPACRHKKVRFEVNRDGAHDSPAPLWADPEQLRQLLLNLTLNGIEAAGPGGWVRIHCTADTRQCRIEVSDSGAGPPDNVVERLFESFVTSKPEGVGLGLAADVPARRLHAICARVAARGGRARGGEWRSGKTVNPRRLAGGQPGD